MTIRSSPMCNWRINAWLVRNSEFTNVKNWKLVAMHERMPSACVSPCIGIPYTCVHEVKFPHIIVSCPCVSECVCALCSHSHSVEDARNGNALNAIQIFNKVSTQIITFVKIYIVFISVGRRLIQFRRLRSVRWRTCAVCMRPMRPYTYDVFFGRIFAIRESFQVRRLCAEYRRERKWESRKKQSGWRMIYKHEHSLTLSHIRRRTLNDPHNTLI